MKIFHIALLCAVCAAPVHAQKVHAYNLAQLVKENKLVVSNPKFAVKAMDNSEKPAVSVAGVAWLKDIHFKEGTIDIDLRGKNVFLQSFLGIAFHGVDSIRYDAVYFRPFNFRHADTLRRKWSVQYFSLPEYDYDKLRKDHPLVYENAVTPVPEPDDWFHATIVIKDNWVTVYVNHSAIASLKVRMLNERADGNIGLWSAGEVNGVFANLTITE